MKFADSIQNALSTQWSFINTFDVSFDIPSTLANESGWSNARDGRAINLHVVSIDTPQFTNSPIEVFVANRWVLHNGRDEVYRFNITFRDSDQMALYRKFVKMYQMTRELYFDSAAMTITLSKDADYANEADSILFRFEETLIENVSQLQFSNTTENQIAEFTVGFKCVKPKVFSASGQEFDMEFALFDFFDFG